MIDIEYCQVGMVSSLPGRAGMALDRDYGVFRLAAGDGA
jgi:hypothetical protein